MENDQHALAFIELYKQQMQRFGETQNIEWKANFGIWTLLAGAIYLALQVNEHVQVSLSASWLWPIISAVLLAGVCVHGWWLHLIHQSQAFDKKLWMAYRKAALVLLGADASIVNLGDTDVKSPKTEFVWLSLEIGMTLILCLILFWLLTARH